ncbi:MAG: hypothetical protein ACM37W_04660 [Actinomycetota bacterium]
MNPQQQEDIQLQNARSLQTLCRTLTMSQGEFSLILVRCNYAHLREEMVQKLHEQCSVEIQELFLSPSTKTLYSSIEAELTGQQPAAVMVFGLEGVRSIDQLLNTANQVREVFPNNFHFPLLLWVNDPILKKLVRLVPDIESWTTSVEFALGPSELLAFLHQSTERLFATELEGAAWRLTNTAILGANACTELESARKDLEYYGMAVEPVLEGSLEFIRGRHEYAIDSIDAALERYQQSLNLWRTEASRSEDRTERQNSLFTLLPSSLLQGIALFHIGLCYRRRAQVNRTKSRADRTEAKIYLQQSLNLFEQAGREDLVAKFINQLGEILQQLEDWEGLWDLAVKARRLHQPLGEASQIELAQDYGFLADVALHQEHWEDAQEWAQIALEILDRTPEGVRYPSSIKSQHQGLYWLLLAQAEHHLGRRSLAVNYLETARLQSERAGDAQLHLQILAMLQKLYFQEKRYLDAFKIKQEYRTTEHLYGFRAFIGAAKLQPQRRATNPAMESATPMPTVADEITASGRLQDVNRLIERISSPQYKLTVIYGQSGVGKSSLVTAGLVPALAQKVIESREVVPVVLQVYNDWTRELGRKLAIGGSSNEERIAQQATLATSPLTNGTAPAAPPEAAPEPLTPDTRPLIEQLQRNAEQNRLTVLIFDQFEEFFFVWKEPAKRLIFFNFMREILNIPFVKVLLSMREDCLHYLLEFSRPQTHNQGLRNDLMNDILSKEILYYLGNFSLDDARAIIKSLTERSQFYLEPQLIDALVQDLAGEVGEVRPIELQVVGAQLQEEEITTLADYQKLGSNPKQKLVEQLLEEVVTDCGAENERAARRILYLLTEENDTRPLKTRAELGIDLATFEEADKLDLVLEILVKSGLVFRWTEGPTELYQLVHDYLVSFIRQQQEQREQLDRQAEVAALQEQNKRNRAEIERLRKEQELNNQLAEARERQVKAEEKLSRNRKRQLAIATVGIFALMGVAAFAWVQKQAAETASQQAEFQRKQAEQAQLDALNSNSRDLLIASKNDPLGILAASIRVARASQINTMPIETKNQIEERLRQVVSGVQEVNSFDEQHTKGVAGVSFSPDGTIIASASLDNTVVLWNKTGTVRRILKHSDGVLGVSFSPDGKTLATACADKTVKLWRVADGTELATLKNHDQTVTSVSFSPDGKTLVSGSYDNTVKIWTTSGKLLKTLTGHSDWVLGVSFSPDGKTIASASADQTVKLWNLEGKELKTLKGHSDLVYSVSFSPDGKELASASADNTVKLWNLQGKELQTLRGHNADVISVSFSPDGQTLVTGSADTTIKVWGRDGTLLNTIRGHQGEVRSVNFSREGTIASGSYDKTVKLWRPDSTPLSKILTGHSDWVYSVQWSIDGQAIASASRDQTVRLWKSDGTFLRTLEGHENSVSSVSFSPKGNLLASGSEDRTVKLWNLDGKLLKTFRGHNRSVFSVSFSPTGDTLATASEDKTVKLWSLDDGKELQTLNHDDSVNSVAWSPKGDELASGSFDKTVKLWRFDGRQATLYQTLKHDGNVNSVSFNRGGQILASASDDKTVKLWSLDGKLLTTLKHDDRVLTVTFSPDGKLMATSSADKKLRLWDIQGKNATLRKTLMTRERVTSVSFSPDSKMLAWGGPERTVALWSLDNLQLDSIVVRGCQWLQDYLNSNPNVSQTSDRTLCQDVKSP